MLIAAVMALPALTAHAEARKDYGPLESRTQKITGRVSSIEVEALVTLEYHVSDRNEIEIDAPEKLMADVEISHDADDGSLSVGLRGRRDKKVVYSSLPVVKVSVYCPLPSEFECESMGRLNVATPVSTTGKLSFSCESSGQITIRSATCARFDADAESMGSIKVRTVVADHVDLSAESMGKIDITLLKADTLKASAESMGKVTVAGKSGTARLSAESMGKVNAKGLKCPQVKATSGSMGRVSHRK